MKGLIIISNINTVKVFVIQIIAIKQIEYGQKF
jgi:hypothetical protein